MVSLVAARRSRPRCQALCVKTSKPCRNSEHLNGTGFCKFHVLQCRGLAKSTGQRCRIKRNLEGNQFCQYHVRQGGADTSAGTKILVKNLKFDIIEDDMHELFSTVGKVSKTEIVYDRSGLSKGIALVWFVKHADAEKAIKQYDGRTLDGQAMMITLDSDKNVCTASRL